MVHPSKALVLMGAAIQFSYLHVNALTSKPPSFRFKHGPLTSDTTSSCSFKNTDINQVKPSGTSMFDMTSHSSPITKSSLMQTDGPLFASIGNSDEFSSLSSSDHQMTSSSSSNIRKTNTALFSGFTPTSPSSYTTNNYSTRGTTTMLRLSTTLRLPPPRTNPFASIITNTLQRQPKNFHDNVRSIKKRATLSSMILLAHIMFYGGREERGGMMRGGTERAVEIKRSNHVTTITHCEMHRSRLSDSSTFEFERRAHKEVNDEDGGVNDVFESTTLETVSGVGVVGNEYSTAVDGRSGDVRPKTEEEDDEFLHKTFASGEIESLKEDLEDMNILQPKVEVEIQEEEDVPKVEIESTLEEKRRAKKVKVIDMYSKSSDAGDRAFALLLGLNMVELTPDPEDPDYDDSHDDEIFTL